MRDARRLRAVLFDKDGTLIDFRASWVPVYRALAAELAVRSGRPPAFTATLLARLGLDVETGSFSPTSPLLWATNDAIAAAWAAQPELAEVGDVAALVDAFSSDRERFPPVAVDGLERLFTRLADAGFALGIATMDTTAQAHDTAARLGLQRHLAFVTGCDGEHGEKPDPGMVLGFCAATGTDPSEVVMVGDTLVDLTMGRRAGCGLVVGVLTGGLGPAELHPHADHVLDSVAQLETLLLGDDINFTAR